MGGAGHFSSHCDDVCELREMRLCDPLGAASLGHGREKNKSKFILIGKHNL